MSCPAQPALSTLSYKATPTLISLGTNHHYVLVLVSREPLLQIQIHPETHGGTPKLRGPINQQSPHLWELHNLSPGALFDPFNLCQYLSSQGRGFNPRVSPFPHPKMPFPHGPMPFQRMPYMYFQHKPPPYASHAFPPHVTTCPMCPCNTPPHAHMSFSTSHHHMPHMSFPA
jgi:hypothetical protein